MSWYSVVWLMLVLVGWHPWIGCSDPKPLSCWRTLRGHTFVSNVTVFSVPETAVMKNVPWSLCICKICFKYCHFYSICRWSWITMASIIPVVVEGNVAMFCSESNEGGTTAVIWGLVNVHRWHSNYRGLLWNLNLLVPKGNVDHVHPCSSIPFQTSAPVPRPAFDDLVDESKCVFFCLFVVFWREAFVWHITSKNRKLEMQSGKESNFTNISLSWKVSSYRQIFWEDLMISCSCCFFSVHLCISNYFISFLISTSFKAGFWPLFQ